MIKAVVYFAIILIVVGCNERSTSGKISRENAQKGEDLFNSAGCKMCHSVSGEKLYGPTLNKILNTNIQVIRNNKIHSVFVDRGYIKRSIQNPDYEKVIDFQNQKMPRPELTSKDIDLIVDYLIFLNDSTLVLDKN